MELVNADNDPQTAFVRFVVRLTNVISYADSANAAAVECDTSTATTSAATVVAVDVSGEEKDVDEVFQHKHF